MSNDRRRMLPRPRGAQTPQAPADDATLYKRFKDLVDHLPDVNYNPEPPALPAQPPAAPTGAPTPVTVQGAPQAAMPPMTLPSIGSLPQLPRQAQPPPQQTLQPQPTPQAPPAPAPMSGVDQGDPKQMAALQEMLKQINADDPDFAEAIAQDVPDLAGLAPPQGDMQGQMTDVSMPGLDPQQEEQNRIQRQMFWQQKAEADAQEDELKRAKRPSLFQLGVI